MAETIKNLKPGDVVVFEAEGAIGNAIALLTGSAVSHAALAYNENEMIEMVLEGIKKEPINKYGERKVFQRRHKTVTDVTPVLNAANFYLEKNPDYNLAGLLLLGGLIVLGKIPYNPKIKKIVDKILKILCWHLNKIINEKKHGKENYVMTCSQFVYQCFFDAGDEYRIIIKDGVLQSTPADNGTICLAKLLENHPNNVMCDLEEYNIGSINEAELADELCSALENKTEIPVAMLDVELTGTLSIAKRFLELAEILAQRIGIPLPSLFVTPADLYKNAENLDNIGE